MSSSMLQETVQTSPSNTGPRFRPYASPNHRVTKGRYITSNDPRGYIPVYEYPLNGQWIMMDIDDGYILWTGIWKALGNSKADIVKMIDSQPDLAPLIRRVRGGYLKIQGTWMPYEVALRLSRRVAWPIRDDLIPLFGPTFPSTCLSPDQPGFGQVVASGPNRRRARRNPQPNTSINPPREPWTVVTPHDPAHSRETPPPRPPYIHTAFYPPNRDVNFHHSYAHSSLPSPRNGSASIDDPASPSSTSRSSVRYSPYNAPYPVSRPSLEGRKDLSLDIPSLSLRDIAPPSCRVSPMEHITLAPIHTPPDLHHSTSPYALPPISAMEDLRGLHVNDSAAVLRRLKAEDPSSSEGSRRSNERRVLLQPAIRPRDTMNCHEVYTSRPYLDHIYRGHSSSESDSDNHTSYSTCDPSPVSPATPRSASSNRDHNGPGHPSLAPTKGYDRYYATPLAKVSDWPNEHPREHDEIRVSDVRFVGRRHSDTDGESHPHRPW